MAPPAHRKGKHPHQQRDGAEPSRSRNSRRHPPACRARHWPQTLPRPIRVLRQRRTPRDTLPRRAAPPRCRQLLLRPGRRALRRRRIVTIFRLERPSPPHHRYVLNKQQAAHGQARARARARARPLLLLLLLLPTGKAERQRHEHRESPSPQGVRRHLPRETGRPLPASPAPQPGGTASPT